MTAEDSWAPKYPAVHLFSHVLQKGFQAGSVIGVVAVVPAVLLLKRGATEVPPLLRAANTLGYSAAAGTALSGAMCTAKFVNMDREGLEDRVYRLHYNEGQNRTDAFCAAGSTLGAAAAALLLARHGVPLSGLNVTGGAALGAALGVFAHVLTRPEEQRTPNKALHELKN